MREIDMSAEAVTSRLKLVAELNRLCLKLGTAKILGPAVERHDKQAKPGARRTSLPQSK